MKPEIIQVTPALAEDWLKKNTNNRDYAEQQVKRLVAQMRDNQWQDNGETIKFSVGGELLDGQHRLMAIVRSGMTQRLLVVRGLARDSFSTIDVGRKRSSADAMKVAKVPEYKRVAVALPFVLAYDRKVQAEMRIKMSPNEALEYLEDYSDLPLTLVEIGSKRCPLMPRFVFDSLYYIFRRIDAVLAYEYMEALRSGTNIESCNAWRIVRERLIREASKAPGIGKLDDKNLAALVIKGWNHARSGTDAQRVMWKPAAEEFPEAI
jgi:hypothetical protein